MGRSGFSETPYRGIVEALKNISSEMIELNRTLNSIRNATNLQAQYLAVITKKYHKKGFKKIKGRDV
jgi:hypothetical protein